MKKIIYITAVLFVFAGCDKDSFETKPQITLESVKPDVVPRNANLELRLKYTDKEGDLGKGNVWIQKQILNVRPLPPPSKVDSFSTKLVTFPDTPEGEILIRIPWNFLIEYPNLPDTLRLRVAVTDIKGNTSDTLVTDKIVVLQQ
jgi:hypothetical protein